MGKRKGVTKAERAAAFLQQPAVAEIVRKLQSKRGATVDELRGDREPHSIRATISRIRSVGLLTVIFAETKRGNVYRVSPKKRSGE